MKAAAPGIFRGWRLAVGDPAARPLFALLIAAAALASGWAIAALPPVLAVSMIGGVVALTLWLQAPILAVYALVAIIPFSLSVNLGGIDGVSVKDALILALAIPVLLALASRSQRSGRLQEGFARRVMAVWVPLVVWCSIAFLIGPENQSFLGGPVHNTWYVYTDTWRSMLVFPLVLIGLDQRRSVDFVLDLIVAVGAGVAIHAIVLARLTSENATAHFDHPNPLAGYLVMVLPFAVARAAMHPARWARLLCAVAAVCMLRALWLTGSRGGLVAFLASMAVLAMFIPMRRAGAAAVVALVGLALVIGYKGLNLPMLERFIVLRDYKEVETFQWRQEQWGIFMDRVRERPLFGWGSDVDESMRDLDRARTAHNAFLALSVKSGIPSAIAWMVLLALAAALGLRNILSPQGSDLRWFWAGLLAFLAAIVVHNLVESMLLTHVSQGLVWTVLACAALLSRPLQGTAAATPGPALPARPA